jgi:hypothetical protein
MNNRGTVTVKSQLGLTEGGTRDRKPLGLDILVDGIYKGSIPYQAAGSTGAKSFEVTAGQHLVQVKTSNGFYKTESLKISVQANGQCMLQCISGSQRLTWLRLIIFIGAGVIIPIALKSVLLPKLPFNSPLGIAILLLVLIPIIFFYKFSSSPTNTISLRMIN